MAENKTERRLHRAMASRNLPVRSNVNIQGYEVDFLLDDRVVVEVDGYHHLSRDGQKRDARKDRQLRHLGYRVYRIPAEHVWITPERRSFVQKLQLHLQAEEAALQRDEALQPLSGEDRAKLQRLREHLHATKRTEDTTDADAEPEEESPRSQLWRHLERHFPQRKQR